MFVYYSWCVAASWLNIWFAFPVSSDENKSGKEVASERVPVQFTQFVVAQSKQTDLFSEYNRPPLAKRRKKKASRKHRKPGHFMICFS